MRYSVTSLLRRRSGFTLIEILIVVAIIGVLSSVVLVGLRPAQQRGRDTRRIADLKEVQNGLELYYQKCGFYPGAAECASTSPATDWNGLVSILTGSEIGVKNLPTDPNSSKEYAYVQLEDGVGYVLGADLEDAGNPALATDIDGTFSGVNCNDPTYCIEF